jgi:hypothetical protein
MCWQHWPKQITDAGTFVGTAIHFAIGMPAQFGAFASAWR